MADFESLLEDYKRKKKELAQTEDSLRHIYGRKPYEEIGSERTSKQFRRRSSPTSERMHIDNLRERKRSYYNEKDRNDTSENDTPDEDESPSKKPSLQSAVITKHQHRTKKDIIAEQNVKVTARNKRLFGSLVLGTLKKFEHEEKTRKSKDCMRVIIENKIEREREKEKEKILIEKDNLLKQRKQMKTQVRCIEKQLERAESHEVYESNLNTILKSNSMITRSEPRLFFKPATHNADTKKCLEESQAILKEFISEKKVALETDLLEIKESYRKDSVLVNEENKCLKDESESQDLPETGSESIILEQEDTPIEVDDESTDERRFGGSLEDQDFEPIYD